MTQPSVEPNEIEVRRVTNVQASWTEGAGEDRPGAFTIQLILSNGADYYVLHPTAEDAKVQLQTLKESETVIFDKDRKVLIPNRIR